MSERTSARYDEIADFYDGVVGNAVADPATTGLLSLVGEVRDLRLLDLACGQGRIARALARRGAKVVGADISDALLDKARVAEKDHQLGITYVHADVTAHEWIQRAECERVDGLHAPARSQPRRRLPTTRPLLDIPVN